MIKIMPCTSITLLSVLFILLFSPVVHAEMHEIPLQQAVEQFYKNNYDIIIGTYEIDKSYADYIGAKLLPNPGLSINYTGAEAKLVPTATDTTQLTARIEQLFELGGKRELRSRAASETYEAAKLLHKDAIRTLLASFYTNCYNLKLDLLNLEATRDELARFDRTLAIAEKRYNAGHLSLVDYTKVKLARIDLEANLTSMETQLKNDSEQFALLIAKDQPLQPQVFLDEEFLSFEEGVLVTKAYENRFDFLALRKQLDAAGYNLSLAKAGRIPDVTIGVELESFGRQNTLGLGAGLSIPLPFFNRNQGDIGRRNAEYNQIEHQLDKVKRQIVADVRQALNNRSGALRVLASYKTRKQEIQELRDRSENAFTLGGITAIDLLDTEKTYRDFITKYNQTLVQGNLQGMLLKIATGELM